MVRLSQTLLARHSQGVLDIQDACLINDSTNMYDGFILV